MRRTHMKNILKLTLLSVVFMAANIQAMDPKMFRGSIIDAQTIKGMAPEAPEDVNKHATTWLKDNPEFARTALGYQRLVGLTDEEKAQGLLSATRKTYDATQALILEKTGAKNMSDWNCAFRLPTNRKWVVKAAGVANIRQNVNRAAAHVKARLAGELDKELNPSLYYNYNAALTHEDYDRLKQNLEESQCDSEMVDGQAVVRKDAPKTFQTVSRMAYHLRLQEVIEQENLPLVLPAMHFVHIPGRPKAMSDRNYVILERHLKGLTEVSLITPEEDVAIKRAIEYSGLFGLNTGSLKRTKFGELAVLDLEQPNNSNPLAFFHKTLGTYNAYKGNYEAGLRDYDEHFKDAIKAGKEQRQRAENADKKAQRKLDEQQRKSEVQK